MTLAEGISRPLWPLGRWIGRRLWWIEHAFERARGSERAIDDTRLRVFFVLVLFAAGFAALGLGATRAALFPRFVDAAASEVPSPNARGEILDRNGAPMALDVPRWGLYVDPREILFKAKVRAALLAALPKLAPARLDRALAGDRRTYVDGGLTPEVEAVVHDLGLPGVSFEPESGRDYPLGPLAAHLIGFASSDGAGLAGAEKAFDAGLRADGGQGATRLSIDLRVQGALEDELDAAAQTLSVKDAVGIVADVRSGEILALASWPSYDPNDAAGADPAAMVDHAAASVYEPGSVMKVFTLAMGLDAGVATPETMFDVGAPLQVGAQTIHDFDHGESQLSLAHVFTHSSNIGAARLGLMAGAPTMSRYFHAFGLFGPAPGELVESARPLTPRALTPNIVASMSFGHAISFSPLALATGMSAILNGGVWRPLTILRRPDGKALPPGRRVISEATSRTMLGLMRMNVVEGTGAKAENLGLRVGGKTGTATKLVGGHYDKGRNARNLASFAAIFPTDGPIDADRYLVLVMLDEPKANAADGGVTTAAMTAAPLAGRVINRIAPFVGVRRVIIASDLGPKAVPASLAIGANEQ